MHSSGQAGPASGLMNVSADLAQSVAAGLGIREMADADAESSDA